MWVELFGKPVNCRDISLANVTLPCLQSKPMDKKKVVSLAKKYDTIPEEARWYYPDVGGIDLNDVEDGVPTDNVSTPSSKKRKGKVEVPVAPGVKKKKVGRPKNAVVHDASQRTLISMFREVPTTRDV